MSVLQILPAKRQEKVIADTCAFHESDDQSPDYTPEMDSLPFLFQNGVINSQTVDNSVLFAFSPVFTGFSTDFFGKPRCKFPSNKQGYPQLVVDNP